MKTNIQLSTIQLFIALAFLIHGNISAQNTKPPKNGKDCLVPPEWNMPAPAPTSAVIVIDANAKLLVNGQMLNEDDVIGGFYLDENGIPKCGGFGCVKPDLAIPFVLFGDDPSTTKKEGFAPGEEILFKAWSWMCQKTCNMDSVIAVEFPKSTVHWQAYESSMIIYMAGDLPVDCHDWQGYTLKFSKGWNEFVFPKSDITIKEFASRLDRNLLMIKEKSGNGIYWPGKNIHALALKPGTTYRLKVTNDIEISLPGND